MGPRPAGRVRDELNESEVPLNNPLLERLEPGGRIPFDRIRAEHVEPALSAALAEARRRIDEVASGSAGADDPLKPLDDLADRVARVWAPVSHLANVHATPTLRQAHAAALPDLAKFWTRLLHHDGLHRRLREFSASREEGALSALRARHLRKTLREFRRAGAGLEAGRKQRLERLRVELAELGRRFEENVLDETAAFAKHLSEPDSLAGLPEDALALAAQRAKERDLPGWTLTLDMPSVQAVLKHADDRGLRQEIYEAYMGRCAGGEHDNGPLAERILAARRELAGLLGYDGFPDYRLEDAMARTGEAVRRFLDDLAGRTRPFYERDARQLEARARQAGMGALQPWDVAYLTERMRKERFDVDDEALRSWFPLEEVQAGLFEIARHLFGLSVTEEDASAWHEDVSFFEVRDEAGVHLGSFYTDWFPRDTKRQGAWMDSLISGGPRSGGFEPNLGFVGANFTPPSGGRPALLTHAEVRTLFHEFGHLLHHVASRVEIPGRGGVNVAWDWVEVPSQIMENWTWEAEPLAVFARHHETGEPLPPDLLDQLLAARRFMGGWRQMRQVALANLDLELHRSYSGDAPLMAYAAEALRPFVPSRRFVELHGLASFSHVFGGGYASAYYSYLWSETLEADAFSRFRSEGSMNPATGRAFLDCVLSQGDRHDPEELFRAFMGRDPEPGALIRRNLGTTLDEASPIDSCPKG